MPDDEPEPKLSEREREVLTLIKRGCGRRTIAARLGISPITVRCHVRSILSKYRAPNQRILLCRLLREREARIRRLRNELRKFIPLNDSRGE